MPVQWNPSQTDTICIGILLSVPTRGVTLIQELFSIVEAGLQMVSFFVLYSGVYEGFHCIYYIWLNKAIFWLNLHT